MFQQGDILIQKRDEIKGEKLSHQVLAKGEATGHAHRVSEGEVELYKNNEFLYLRVISNSAVIVHEEHLPITLPQGDFEVRRVREYDHFAEEARTVQD